MAAPTFPTYLEPLYINYDMIKNLIPEVIIVQDDAPVPDTGGLYIGDVNTYMAEAESYVIKTILANYVQIPLETLDGGTFNDLYSNPAWRDTYIIIRDLFCSYSAYKIYLNYFSVGGTNNGSDLMKAQSNQVNIFRNSLLRLDQAANPSVKNAFVGLKVARNRSKTIPGVARVPCIPLGRDQAIAAFNAMPDLRFGFNR